MVATVHNIVLIIIIIIITLPPALIMSFNSSPHVAFPCCWNMICRRYTYWTSHFSHAHCLLFIHQNLTLPQTNPSSQCKNQLTGAFWVGGDVIASTSCLIRVQAEEMGCRWEATWFHHPLLDQVVVDLEVVQLMVQSLCGPGWRWSVLSLWLVLQ